MDSEDTAMSDPVWTTKEIVKSGQYGAKPITSSDLDGVIDQMIVDITAQMIDYLDNDDIDAADPGSVLKRACAKQTAYELQRRPDIGLSSVTFPNGNVNKFSVDEWLPDVKKILERNRYYAI
jgi:hypothetical protein